MEFCRCHTSFVFTNSESETCIFHFPAIPPCSTKVDVLETGDVPILSSLPQMKNLGIELDPKGDKVTCPAFGLYSSPAEYSTMGQIVLDLTNLAYQPTTKSLEQPGHPKRHVTFAMSERKTAHPAHAPDMHEDEDEDHKPLVRPASRRELAEERRDLDNDDEDLLPLVPPRPPPAAPVRKRKGPPVRLDPAATLEQEVSRDSHERAEDTSILGKKAEGEALRNIISKLSEERNLRDLHLKHYHISTAQFKKRTTHLDIMPVLQFHKTETGKISRERTSGRRIWRRHLSGPWIGKD